ncbi:MAG: LptF/LptG family permease [Phycisphaerales bacterium JB040]
MPRTLWRYIFLETVRLVAIAAVVLVTVIAFAATVKPLADGKLDPAQAVSFMLLAVPPMMAYALPFAAGFGTTLAYHRLADDNEDIAARAGGLSHRSILVPALALGLLLAGGVVLLNDQIIPRFLRKMEQIITLDLTQVMVNQLDRGQSATFNNTEIHADSVLEYPPPDGSPHTRMVRLQGLTAIETDSAGDVTLEATSSSAWLVIVPAAALTAEQREAFGPDETVAKIIFDDGNAMFEGEYFGLEGFETPAQALPSVFDDDPKYLTGAQLEELKDHPDGMSFIQHYRLALAREIARTRTARTLVRRAERDHQVIFDAPGDRTIYAATGPLATHPEGGWRLSVPPGRETIGIEELDSDGTLTRSTARSARLLEVSSTPGAGIGPGRDSAAASIRFRLELEGVEIGTSTGDSRFRATTQRDRLALDALVLEGDPMRELASRSSHELLAEANADGDHAGISERARQLRERIARLNREILSKQHERYAMAGSCLVMVLTGAVVALRLKDAMPLVVYLWSFFPALATIILIASGQSATHKNGLIGLPLLWAGVVGLGAYTFGAYRAIARH